MSSSHYCYDTSLFSTTSQTIPNTCAICLNIIKSALSLPCGHTFGAVCLNEWLQKDNLTCPTCRFKFERKEIVKCYKVDMEVNGYDMYCKYNKIGCKYIGNLRNIKEHEYNCDYNPKPCKYCNQIVTYETIHYHDTKMKCSACEDSFFNCVFNLHQHYTCRNNCAFISSSYDVLHLHYENCPFESIPCMYADYGCKFKGTLNERQIHEKEFNHQYVFLSEFESSKMLIKKLQDRVADLEFINTEQAARLFDLELELSKKNDLLNIHDNLNQSSVDADAEYARQLQDLFEDHRIYDEDGNDLTQAPIRSSLERVERDGKVIRKPPPVSSMFSFYK